MTAERIAEIKARAERRGHNCLCMGCAQDRTAILAALEAAHARIAELEAGQASRALALTANSPVKHMDDLRSQLAAAEKRIAELEAENALIKCGEPNHPDRAYAMKGWLKTFGFQVYVTLNHGEVGYVLSLLQAGDITRGKAAEAIAELLVGNEPPLPQFVGDVFGEDDLPREAVGQLKQRIVELEARLDGAAAARQDEVFGLHEIIVEMSRELAARAKIDAAREVPRG